MPTLAELARRLDSGATNARSLVEEALERIQDPAGEGARVFIHVGADTARARADEIDRLRAAGQSLPPWAGIPIGIKDLFDVEGEVTRAGSRILENAPAAREDAPAVARLRRAGFIFIGRTNMTEFAYSGLGLNPHYGTPLNPFDRATGRIPGGSTSGGAVAVTDGMAVASLGTDTGGSCRIPAALTGIVGFKPTADRVPRNGTIPLSPTLDSVGPLANSVACCATLDAILRDAPMQLHETPPMVAMKDQRLLLPTTFVLDDMDDTVACTFERAVDALARSGALIQRAPVYEFEVIPDINFKGGLAAAEAYAWHRQFLDRYAERYDPRVIARILKGQEPSAEDIRQMRQARRRLIESFHAATREWHALIMPTVPVIAPPLSAVALDADYVRLNMLILRNPALANFLDGCGVSLPIHAPGDAPVGLMLIGRQGEDAQLLALAATIEQVLARSAPSVTAA
ncbi:aspartyl-tRNA(Asn)/glutamyl-tRNA(Gln) amidotransferase subunit A [Steroidobacter denitrificans]|uniref:Aspartyl-tRNA(Asn)/glutamyl-tRNA(Gln) amidotransferase subunit A n=1 Tax=Steroidobacter denitrificans TaxID=465721 RepID=A0A127FB43_STEDE|nr:amidase [Steroidobacter denitrificans]AMN47643.1 aspartyl-tRNA(Asn)/glutamyl-tRNA(Gln) amidotransferase subunit A [Steroidobacter denitrificans]